MIGTGTWINAGAVLAGSAVGSRFGERLPARMQETFVHLIGLFTLFLGMKMAWGTANEGLLLASLLIGAIVGEALRIEEALERLGKTLERRFGRGKTGFGNAIITPTLLFCVGPMTLMGYLNDGISGDHSLLVTKSVMDGCSSVAFAAAFGWPVALSAISVLGIQGALTLGAAGISHLLTASMTTEIFAVGGILLLALGVRLLDLKPIRVANLLPALGVAPLLVWWVSLAARIFGK